MTIKAIPTRCDGIEFRSKLEAHWYLCFKSLGLNPLYEPEVFNIETMSFDLGGSSGIARRTEDYTPDFLLQSEHCFVEIKPKKMLYDSHDCKSIRLCCVLGYEKKAALVLGSPFEYSAVLINERHEGFPSGFFIKFMKDIGILYGSIWDACSFYPDEEEYEKIDTEMDLEIGLNIKNRTENASATWNQLKWKRS